MHLEAFDHRVALAQYEETIAATTLEVTLLAGPDARAHALDRLTSLLQLRKLHKVRLAELEDEEGVVAPLASAQWAENERQPALV